MVLAFFHPKQFFRFLSIFYIIMSYANKCSFSSLPFLEACFRAQHLVYVRQHALEGICVLLLMGVAL